VTYESCSYVTDVHVIGVLHPGAMGSAIGALLARAGHDVLWASDGRSAETAARARAAGLEDAGTVAELAARSDVILSICPPHGAIETAHAVGAFDGMYVDANAISPATAAEIAAIVARYVDGGIIGPPPDADGATTRLYLSGPEAPAVAALFEGTGIDAPVLGADPTTASALKMAYAGWTKGSAALLLTVRAAARAYGVEDALLAEWEHSLPALPERSRQAARSADEKGWRWVAEMEEIAATMAAADLPAGFHEAAAEVFRRAPAPTPPAAPPAPRR
jgi:3-hydroxyisobutyrate dehydrogenase-like beta-hydroxyacid dehydrogenase